MTRWAQAPERRDQMVLYPSRLDDVLPADHWVRYYDEILDRLDWSEWEAQYHPVLGQPAIPPRVLAGVLLYGMRSRIRSSRALEEALVVRMDFRWLVEGRTIDHSTLSKFRHEHKVQLKKLFVKVCQLAREIGLLTAEQLGYDGTRIKSNNRRSGTRTEAELRKEREEMGAEFDAYMKKVEAEDAHDEEVFQLRSPHQLSPEMQNKLRRMQVLDRALEAFDRAKKEKRTVPKRVPKTDSDSRVMPNKDGGCAPNYTPTATVDIQSGLVAHADVLNQVNEDSHLIESVEEVQEQFGLASPPDVLTDGLNGTGANLAGCAERGIDIYSPCAVPDPATNPALRADPTQPVPEADWDRLPTHKVKSQTQLDKSAFVYDAERDCYFCPLGQALNYSNTTREASGSGGRIRRRYKAADGVCAECPLHARCILGKGPAREINREQYEAHRERHAQKMATPEAQAIYAKRRHPGERIFATIKQQFGMRQFLTRGLDRVQAEWQWAVTAFNLDRLISLLRARAGPGVLLLPAAPPQPTT